MSAPRDGRKDSASPLADAAANLEREMQRFEKLTDTALRTALDSEKHLNSVAETINEAAASHRQFGEHLRVLIEAVSAARDRQQASAAALNTRGEALQARREEHAALEAQFVTLAEQARAINGVIQSAAALKGEATPADITTARDQIVTASEQLQAVAERAKELGNDARTRGLLDLERHADTVRQQVQSARSKLGKIREALEERL